MNKLINWTFGSFFRTLGRFLFYVVIGFIVYTLMGQFNIKLPNIWGVLDVHAVNIGYLITPNEDWNASTSTNVFYNATSAVDVNNNGASWQRFRYHNDNWNYNGSTFTVYQNKDSTSSYATNGNTYYGFTIPLLNLKKGYNYTVNLYFGGSWSINDITYIGAYSGTRASSQPTSSTIINNTIGSVFHSSVELSSTSLPATIYSVTFDYNSDYSYIILEYKNNSSGSLSFTQIGYLGCEFINNGTITTLNDISEQQNANHQETMDYITDDTAPNSDISSLGTVEGLLPAGPVDSLLNIPLMFLSVITSSLGGQCVPLEGNFVFNSTLSIPCFGDSFYNNVPNTLMSFINLIPSAFILIMYFKHLYKKVDRAVSMESNADDEWGVI